MSIKRLIREDTRRAILRALALDRGYSLNHRILVRVVEQTTAVTLSDDETGLTYDLEVSDPEMFTEPVSARWEFNWRPDMVVERYGCTLDD